MQGKSILLIIGGGIAAYKCLDFIRRAKERGAKVRCILTRSAQHFVTPLSAAVLSEEPAFTELFDLKNETEIGHIRLSREADRSSLPPPRRTFSPKWRMASPMILPARCFSLLTSRCWPRPP